MLTNFKSPECTLCGKSVVGIIHMGCDAAHCSERCAREYLRAVRKCDPNMENPGAWPGGSTSNTLKRKPSLACITEEALHQLEPGGDLTTESPDDETGQMKYKSGPSIRLTDEAKAVAGAILVIILVACLGLI